MHSRACGGGVKLNVTIRCRFGIKVRRNWVKVIAKRLRFLFLIAQEREAMQVMYKREN